MFCSPNCVDNQAVPKNDDKEHYYLNDYGNNHDIVRRCQIVVVGAVCWPCSGIHC